MNKKEAANLLGLSEKTVERYKSSGKLSARMKRVVGDDGKSRKVLDFDQSDLERLKRELSGDLVFPVVIGQTRTDQDTDRHGQTDTRKRHSLCKHWTINHWTDTDRQSLSSHF